MLALLTWSLLTSYSSAQGPQTPPAVDLVSIERLEAELPKKFKSPQARKLKRAWDALDAGRAPEARRIAGSVANDPLFGDLALWIQATAERGIAEKSDPGSALDHAKLARSLWTKIEDRQPLSPALKQIERERAALDLIEARALTSLKRDELAFASFDRGFHRLLVASLTAWIDLESLQSFGTLCQRLAPARCQPWWARFSFAYNKSSPEIRLLQKFSPSVMERARVAAGVGRGSVAYKAPDLDTAAFELVLKSYQEERYSEAARGFQQFLESYPRSGHRFRARFWLAQALVHEQEHDKATRAFESLLIDSPLSYYGLVSALATGRTTDTAITPTVPEAASDDPNLYPAEIFHLRRARHLIAEKALDLAAQELREMRPRETHSSPFLAYLAMLNHTAGNSLSAFAVLGELINRGFEGVLTSSLVRMIFPLRHWELIKKYSQDLALDPILILSLIKQESAFESGARSGVGATGLMQIMPQTAVETDPRIDLAKLGDPEINIRTGTKYLKQLLGRFNGNIAFALAGYNAGPSAVDRWTKDAPAKRGVQEFIESIPYRETREYVAGIIRNYYWYSRRITGEFPKSITQFWGVYGPAPEPGKSSQ